MASVNVMLIIFIMIVSGIISGCLQPETFEHDTLDFTNLSGNLTRLTPSSSNNYNPMWSPDGEKILFLSYDITGRSRDLFIMDSDGNNKKQLTYDAYVNNVAWNSGGKIIFTELSNMWIIEENGSKNKLIEDEKILPNFCLSSDGDVIYVSHTSNDNWDIWAMNVSNSKSTKLISDINLSHYDNMVLTGLKYIPNGSKIPFGFQKRSRGKIYDYVNFDDAYGRMGMLDTTLNTSIETDRFFRWGPDGKKIAFISDSEGNSDIWIMNSDGSSKIPLASNENKDSIGRSYSTFDWSINGKIAYIVRSEKYKFVPQFGIYKENINNIWVIDSDGSNNSKVFGISSSYLSNSSDWISDLAWNPNGSKIAFTFQKDDGINSYIYVFDVLLNKKVK